MSSFIEGPLTIDRVSSHVREPPKTNPVLVMVQTFFSGNPEIRKTPISGFGIATADLLALNEKGGGRGSKSTVFFPFESIFC